MPKRIGNTQTSTIAGHSDILDIRSHKKLVAQDIYPDTANDVVRGVRFDGAFSGSSPLTYLTRTNVTSPTNEKKLTISFWYKRTDRLTAYSNLYDTFDGSNNNSRAIIQFSNSSTLSVSIQTSSSSSVQIQGVTPQVFRDTGSWYHIVINIDADASTNPLLIFVNNIEVVGPNSTAPTVNTFTQPWMNQGGNSYQAIGKGSDNSEVFTGYLANIHFVDGQTLIPSNFGYYDTGTKQWKPKAYAGTYGTNGFYLPMRVGQYTQDETAKAFQYSGNSMVSGFKPHQHGIWQFQI